MSDESKNEMTPNYKISHGVVVPEMFQDLSVLQAREYKPRDDDIIICTYPKCGTTWMQYIVSLILRKGKPFESADDFFRLTPFFEMCGQKAVEDMPRPGAFKIHLPRQLLKHWNDKAKYIFVGRNPKDCCVSMFHHTRLFPGYCFQEGDFDHFFELFINGKTEFNDYFDHLIGYYEVKDNPNVLFVTFESLKADPKAAIMKVANFLGQNYVDELENNPQIMADILHYSSFEFMKTQTNEIWGVFINPAQSAADGKTLPDGVASVATAGAVHKKKDAGSFVRKGVVGDYKSLMKPEQVERLEAKFQEKCKKYPELLQLWKSI